MPSSTLFAQLETNILLASIINNATRDGNWNDVRHPDPSTVRNNIDSRLANLKSGSDFYVAWGPAIAVDQNGYACNLTVVLKGPDDDYRVVTSGTNPDSTYDVQNEDNDVFSLQSLAQLFPCPPDVKISGGAFAGVDKIWTTGSSIDGGLALLPTFVSSISDNSMVQVVGHSLGGALASVLVLCLMESCPNRAYHCNTFGAPTAGNSAFAKYFYGRLGVRGIRVFNTLDTIACGWSTDTLESVKTIYDPLIQTPASVIQKIEVAAAQTSALGYTQPGVAISLPGSIDQSLIASSTAETAFDVQADYQHNDAYIQLLSVTSD